MIPPGGAVPGHRAGWATSALFATTTVTSFIGLALASRSADRVTDLDESGAVWNTARPIIEESLADVAVASIATILVGAWAVGAAVVWLRRIQHSGASVSRGITAGAALCFTGAVVWVAGTLLGPGLGELATDVNAADALEVFEDHGRFVGSWRLQAVGFFGVSAGCMLITLGAVTHHRRGSRHIQTPTI